MSDELERLVDARLKSLGRERGWLAERAGLEAGALDAVLADPEAFDVPTAMAVAAALGLSVDAIGRAAAADVYGL